jgi:hypothetical protein
MTIEYENHLMLSDRGDTLGLVILGASQAYDDYLLVARSLQFSVLKALAGVI